MRLSAQLRTRLALAAAAGTVMATTAAVLTAHAATAGCSVSYTITSQWPGGFTANMSVTNLGDPINGWTLDLVVPGRAADHPGVEHQRDAERQFGHRSQPELQRHHRHRRQHLLRVQRLLDR